MIYQGDLFDVLPTLDAESVDACVTDPPYGLGFMGREWDTFAPEQAAKKSGLRQLDKSPAWRDGDRRVINPNLKGRTVNGAISSSQIEYDYTVTGLRSFQVWTERWAREVLRVLKPGAYLVVCGAPRSHHRMMCGLEDAGFVVRDCFAWLFGQGFPKSLNLGNGKGTALKPAHEPIALAWKSFKGSITACHQQHGTAALNIEACRLGYEDRVFSSDEAQALGRWPANVLLDEDAAAMLDAQTGELASGGNPSIRRHDANRNVYRAFGGQEHVEHERAPDAGGASRFYYVAKPSQEERNFGAVNKHPTVKPVELMRWLVKLVVPVNGVCLDPFTGSGTTGMACAYELRQFIGIEREAEYVAIAERRIAAVAPLFQAAVQP